MSSSKDLFEYDDYEFEKKAQIEWNEVYKSKLLVVLRKHFREDYKPLLLYILNYTQMSVQDDRLFLEEIAKEIQKLDLQSSERFIFVLNKFDARFEDEKDDGMEEILKRVRTYLSEVGIKKPNIIPKIEKDLVAKKNQIKNKLENIMIEEEAKVEKLRSDMNKNTKGIVKETNQTEARKKIDDFINKLYNDYYKMKADIEQTIKKAIQKELKKSMIEANKDLRLKTLDLNIQSQKTKEEKEKNYG